MYFNLLLSLLPVCVYGYVFFFNSVTSVPDVYSVCSTAVERVLSKCSQMNKVVEGNVTMQRTAVFMHSLP